MIAEDLMSHPVAVVWGETPVGEARALGERADVEALPVVDAEGRLIGVVRGSDLLDLPGDDLSPVAEVMTSPAISLGTGATVGELAQVMLAHQLRILPIIAGAKLVGVVDRNDLLRTLVDDLVHDDEVIASRVRSVLRDYAGLRRWGVHVVERVVTVSGVFLDRADRTVVVTLVRTVPGVLEVYLRREHPIAIGATAI